MKFYISLMKKYRESATTWQIPELYKNSLLLLVYIVLRGVNMIVKNSQHLDIFLHCTLLVCFRSDTQICLFITLSMLQELCKTHTGKCVIYIMNCNSQPHRNVRDTALLILPNTNHEIIMVRRYGMQYSKCEIRLKIMHLFQITIQ